MRTPGENPPTFQEAVELNQPMTPQEATEKLATFHNVPSQNVLAAFINLRGFQEGTVVFKEGIANGQPCIVMEGFRPNEKYRAWDHLINKQTGQPISRTG